MKTPKTVVAIHQPNYFPWLGYFFKIWLSDIFILMDNVEYTSSGLTKRVLVRNAWNSDESGYLSVPIVKVANHTLIQDVKIKTSMDWVQQHLGKLYAVYRKAPHFDTHISQVEDIYRDCQEHEYLAEVNIKIIHAVIRILKIGAQVKHSSLIDAEGQKGEYVINLCRQVGGTQYLSGTGARKYQDPEHFKAHGLELAYNEFFSFARDHPYTQSQGTQYLPGLSILDALFNVGVAGILEIFENAAVHMKAKLSTH